MARPALFSEEEISRAQELRDRATSVSERQKALSVLLVAEAHLDAEKTAEILGISHRSVFRNRKKVRVQMELSFDGMTVSLVNPGYVTTEMTQGNSRPMPFVLSADEAARRILRGLEKRSPRIEFPLPMVLIVRLLALLPCTLGDRLIKALSRDKNKNIPSGRTGNSTE